MKQSHILLLIAAGYLSLVTAGAFSQPKTNAFNPESTRAIRIVFYNLENAYDTIDDPFAGDDEFIPDGPRSWNPYRYRQKLKNLYKVILAAGKWSPPDIIGVCETENRRVLEDLTRHTPLSRYPYGIIHKDSPDPRGIDVAALYNEQNFQPIQHHFLPVCFDSNKGCTRDILYIKGQVSTGDTLHLFFNHWPSKWQGELQTQSKRNQAARILRRHIDSIQRQHRAPLILALGDFNDSPQAECMTRYLKTKNTSSAIKPEELYNLSFPWISGPTGTQKYRANWEVLDQVIVSGSLLSGRGLYTTKENAHIFGPSFLLEEDSRFTGSKPFRTYSGYRYIGGFSDHLPVILDLKIKD
jgi:endonuclease/exonuclease/phosphatase family metal-dependent hydrolase